MTSTTLVLVAAICIVAVNGLHLPGVKKRESPPSPNPWSQCGPKLDQCVDRHLGAYKLNLEALIQKIRRTSANDLCNDIQQFESCLTRVLTESPCDELYGDQWRAFREREFEVLDHFCGDKLDDFEANKNCFVSMHFYNGTIRCGNAHLGHTCNQEAFVTCLEDVIHGQSDCGAGSVGFLHEVLEATLYVEGLAQMCPSDKKVAKNFLKHFLNLKRF